VAGSIGKGEWLEVSMMAFYRNYVYPYLVDKLGDPPPIKEIREQIIPLSEGNVLEIGAGSGANFPHYNASRVTKLYALEPNPGMVRLAERRARQMKLNIEYIDLPGERIPLEDGSLDSVVSTFTLCTIPGIVDAMQGLARVLRPDGKLIFLELGLSPDREVQHRQRQLEPICQRLFQGLHLTRNIPGLLREGGFQIKQLEQGYLAEFPKSLSYCWWGIAVPQSQKE
jgi:SAM-dependent methyltransferase